MLKKSKKEKFFLILGGGKNSIELIQKIKKYNFQVILVDRDENCPAKRYADLYICLSTWNPKLILKNLKQVEIILCLTRSSGLPGYSAVYINQSLGYVQTDPLNALALLDKKKIYNLQINNIVSLPKIFHSGEICLNLPIICKPAIEKVGKITTFKLNNFSDLNKKAALAKANAVDREIIYQEYIEGFDVSILGYVINGLYKSNCILDESNIFENMEGSVSHKGFMVRNDENLLKKLKAISQKLVNKFQLDCCPFNLSFRVSESDIFLVETNLDFGGEGIHEYLSKNFGLDIIDSFILDFLDSKTNPINI